LSNHKKKIGNCASWTFTKSNAIRNFLASHVNGKISPIYSLVTCVMATFEGIPPKMELTSTSVASIKPSMVGFKK
jgi:hypothetical protein